MCVYVCVCECVRAYVRACVLACVPEISKEHPASWNMKSVTDGSRNIDANKEKSAVGKKKKPQPSSTASDRRAQTNGCDKLIDRKSGSPTKSMSGAVTGTVQMICLMG